MDQKNYTACIVATIAFALASVSLSLSTLVVIQSGKCCEAEYVEPAEHVSGPFIVPQVPDMQWQWFAGSKELNGVERKPSLRIKIGNLWHYHDGHFVPPMPEVPDELWELPEGAVRVYDEKTQEWREPNDNEVPSA